MSLILLAKTDGLSNGFSHLYNKFQYDHRLVNYKAHRNEGQLLPVYRTDLHHLVLCIRLICIAIYESLRLESK